MIRRPIALLMSLAVGVAGCGGASGSPSASAADYRIVASTSLFADLARLALGDAVQIDAIVPAGIDVHTFEPAPSDVSTIAGADLVLMNGLGLDDWVVSLVDAAQQSDANILRLGEGLDAYGFEYLIDGDGVRDPHVWLDPSAAEIFLQQIASRVVTDRPSITSVVRAALDEGRASLRAQSQAAQSAFSAIPQSRRTIVTFHDAFGYYARAYGITIVGVAVAAPGQDPSAREIAALIDAIRAAGVTTIFSEVQFPSKVLDSIAAETGATVLADLYSDALGAAPGDTYLGAMQANATAIAESMQP